MWRRDGRELYFVSDQDGVPDVYRMNLVSGDVRRITHVSTGISGITSISPTLTVSRQTGRVLFTVFQGQGYTIRALEPSQATGEPVIAADGNQVSLASTLPPGAAVRGAVRDPPRGMNT